MMLVRQLTSLSEAKYLVLIIILLSLALGFFVGKRVDEALLPSENILEDISSDDLNVLIDIHNSSQKTVVENNDPVTEPKNPAPVIPEEEKKSFSKIKKLMDEQISIDMRREINAKLTPTEVKPEIIKTPNGVLIKPTQEAMSVAITLVDEDGSLIVVDITDPLPLD